MNSIKRAKKRKIIKILTGVTLSAIMNYSRALDTGGGLPEKEKKPELSQDGNPILTPLSISATLA